MKAVSREWNKTKNDFLEWLHTTDLKNLFSQNIYYDKLSLWWLTKTYEKDALNEYQWFNDLKEVLNGKKYQNKKVYKFSINKSLVDKIKTKLRLNS